MCRSDRFIAFVLPLLVIIVCGTDAKYTNYGRILESPDYREALLLLSPERMLTAYDRFAVYADDESDVNSTCSSDLFILNEAIAQNETWALTMLDASSKLQSGLLIGNLIDLGQYDECMAVHSKNSDHDVRGRHCMYSISVTMDNVTIPIQPTMSICLPASCSADDIHAFFNTSTSWIDNLTHLKIKIESSTCTDIDSVVWDLEFSACLVILVGFVIFLVACTVIEVIYGRAQVCQYKHPFISTLAMFSLRKSATSILNMDMKEGTLPAIHGIRFLSMAWIVLGHEFLGYASGVTVNTVDIFKWIQSWKSLYVFLATYAVDTFFTISGFLMTYLFLKKISKEKHFNIPMYYLHRYIRLTPAIISLIVCTIVFVPKVGSGARWDQLTSYDSDICRTDWWATLLNVQNFVNDKKNMCLGHLWYIAVEMQLFWISPLILYPLYRTPKIGVMMLTTLFLLSLTISALLIGMRKIRASSFVHETSNGMDFFYDYYVIPYHRAGPWLVGILFGYDVAMHKRRLSKRTAVIGWLVAIAIFAFCTFGTRSFTDPDYEYDVVWETFFSAVSRTIWGLGVCWIIYACINNRAGLISSILSSKIFLPLSRLSYCVYLVHQMLQMINNASLRTPTYFSDYYVWRSFFSTLIWSIVVAFGFSLLFESPVIVLEKILLKAKRVSKYESQKELRPERYEESRD